MPLIDFIRNVGHKIHNVHLPIVHLPNIHPIKAFQHTFMPSAEVGAARRLKVFGTTSKVPPIATAATIAALPYVGMGLAAARAAAPVGENVLQTALRYATSSPFANAVEGGIPGLVGGVARGVVGTSAFVETGNTIQALATGNPHALAPSNYQSAAILGAGFFPGAAHIFSLLGFAGRGIKALGSSAANAIGEAGQDFTGAASKTGHQIVDYAPTALKQAEQYFVESGRNVYNFVGHELSSAGGAISGFATGLGLPSSLMPDIPTNFNISGDIGSKSLEALVATLGLAGAAAYLARKHKKKKHRKKYKGRKTHYKHGRRHANELYF